VHRAFCWVLALALGACSATERDGGPPLPRAPTAEQRTAPAPAAQVRRVVVERLDVPGDQPVFALRGSAPEGRAVGVFLHGHCGHGLGYLQAFQFAAADVGRFIALQGDVRCGSGALRAWSGDPVALDRRIDRALRTYLGHEPPPELVLGGSSAGTSSALALSRRFPGKYRRLVLNSAFRELSPSGLQRGVRAYFFAGEDEDWWPTRLSAERWRAAGLQVELRLIPNAGHSDFAGEGNSLMREAFSFVLADR
jgi:pimeloyl-ACP methyl ester carboxylesterase